MSEADDIKASVARLVSRQIDKGLVPQTIGGKDKMGLLDGKPLEQHEVDDNLAERETCGWCGKQVIVGRWVRTGKTQHVEPAEDGCFILDGNGHLDYFEAKEHQGRTRYRAHWGVCPKGDEARRLDVQDEGSGESDVTLE